MTADAHVSAGWYRDPSGRHLHRWWDGAAWTGHVRGRRADPDVDTIEIAAVRAAPVAAAAVATGRLPVWLRWKVPVLVCVYGGAVGVALGSLAPWVQVSTDVFSANRRGTDGDGVITLALAFLVALVFTLVRSRRAAGLLAQGVGAVMGLVVGYELFDLASKAGDVPTTLDVSVTPGVGLLLTGITALIIAVGGALALGEVEDTPRP